MRDAVCFVMGLLEQHLLHQIRHQLKPARIKAASCDHLNPVESNCYHAVKAPWVRWIGWRPLIVAVDHRALVSVPGY
jgi:hypothetical protein